MSSIHLVINQNSNIVRYKNPCCCSSSRSYCVCWQTIKPVLVASSRSDSTGRVYERTQTLSTQVWQLSVTDGPKFSCSRSQCHVTRPVHAWLSVCLKNTHVCVVFDSSFRWVLWPNDTYYSKRSERTNRNMPARNTLLALTPTPRATTHSVTDRQTDGRTDGQTDYMMMPIADHTV